MENPAREIKNVVRTLTQGTPDEQHDAIYRNFAPGASFEHPFCRVPSFKNLQVPGVGELDSRAAIAAIFKWYKILSPKIDLEIESCVMDEQAKIIYLQIFQVFSIWFLPFYRAPVRLVTVLHLAPSSSSSSSQPQSGNNTPTAPPPPPYKAAQDKLQAVEGGSEPSYAAVAAGEASAASPSSQPDDQRQTTNTRTTRYVIQKQEDLYQVNEFVKFVSLGFGASVAGFLQLLATLFCVVGAAVLGPVMKAVLPAQSSGKEKEKQG